LDANELISPQISPFGGSFPVEKPFLVEKLWRGRFSRYARSGLQTLVSPWNLVGCHGIRAGFRALNGASAVPKTGSALHPSVTAVSVKKGLTVACRIEASFSEN
jgi:hypothetical protein